MSRVWRDIVARIRAGYGHNTEAVVEPGALAIFCPACPQPGVNLPDNWREDERRLALISLVCLFADNSLVGCMAGVL